MKKTIFVLLCVVIAMSSGCKNTGDLVGDLDSKRLPESSGGVPANPNIPTGSGDVPVNPNVPTENGNIEPATKPGKNDALGIGLSGFQKEMSVVSLLRLPSVCKTENGYYLQNEGLLYFMDPATGKMIVVCGKPECLHNDVDCNAWINSSFLSYYEGKLYYRNADAISDGIRTLWSMNLDGTDHRMIQRLQSERITDPTAIQYVYQPMLVNGYIYYIERNTMLYKAKIGADISEAVLLINEDNSGKLDSTWKFWADDGKAYAMNNYMNAKGEYQDVLYLLGESEADTKEIWNSSKLQVVSVSYWYITKGTLYYYVSGSDLWAVNLSSGKNEKIQKLSERVKDGQALFTDADVIVLDLAGRTILVYDCGGNLTHEISLSLVYKEYSDIYSCDLVFADDGCIYMLAYHRVWMSPSSSLYQIDWESGNIRELDTWPASGVAFQESDYQEHIIQLGN